MPQRVQPHSPHPKSTTYNPLTGERYSAAINTAGNTRTENAHVKDYEGLMAVIEPLRRRGMRLAVDDAGSGYSGLQHILQLRPDIIKLDISLTRNIDSDLSRRALASARIGFAAATSSKIVAEGVETAGELATLKALGVHMAQGYFLNKPMPLAAASALRTNATAAG